MSWRWPLLFAAVPAAAVALFGAGLFAPPDWPRVAALVLSAAVAGVLPALIVRRLYALPLRQLADRLAALNAPGQRVYVDGAGPVRVLAQTLNALGERLGERFDRLEGDRRRLSGILGGMIEGVVAVDDGERIAFANRQAGELLGFDPARAEGKKFWEVVRQRKVWDVVLEASGARQPRRAELDWPGSPARSLALYAAPLAGDVAAGLILVVHDVSDLRRLERLRQEFVANVSHELKTPLAVIKACTETLLDGAAADADHRGTFLAQIDEQADRLHALILDLLSLARIESGDESFEAEAIALADLAAECVERHRSRAEAKHVRLAGVPPTNNGRPVTAWADHDAVATILDNLVDNAIKYTPEGGHVDVRWGGGAGTAWLEVADTGVGIPEADLPRVFERFYRVDKARARELGGTGLGLTIVKRLAQTLGGSVAARSTPGHGSVFTVRLPDGPG
jgi:two-component system phosphate regulon sensor histidine kinase PhoR